MVAIQTITVSVEISNGIELILLIYSILEHTIKSGLFNVLRINVTFLIAY